MLKRTRKAALIATVIFVGLYALVWLLSPPITRLVLNKVLTNENVKLTDDSHVRVNLFLSRLTIEDFTLQRRDQATLQIERMQIQYSLLPLLSQEVRINKITLDGFSMELDVDGDDAHVAGFLLNRPKTETSDVSEDSEPQAGRKVAIAVPEITLKNLDLRIKNGLQTHSLKFNAINIERTLFHQAVLNSHATLDGSIDGANFKIETRVNYGVDSASAKLELSLKGLPLEQYRYNLPKTIKTLDGRATINLKAEVERNGTEITVENIESSFNLNEANFADQTYRAKLDELQLHLNKGHLSVSDVSPLRFEGVFQLEVNKIESALANTTDHIAGFESLKITSTQVVHQKDTDVQIEQIILNNLWFSDPTDEAVPTLTHLSQILIDDITANTHHGQIGRIALSGGEVNILRDNQGHLSNLVATSHAPPEIDAPETDATVAEPTDPEATKPNAMADSGAPKPDEKPPYLFELTTFEVIKPIKISIRDDSVKPQFDETFFLANAHMEGLSNSTPQNRTRFSMAVNDGEFFKFDLEGTITPFAENMDGDFKLKTREFTLPEVSPYVSDALGFNISAGQMDLDFNGEIKANQLESLAKAHLRGAEFKSDKNYDEKDMLGQTAIPLNVALGMLKDGDGNIKLKIPVNGDIRSPDFSLRHIVGLVVRKAAMSQAKSYLIKTFVPYGQVLSVAMAAGSFALKVRFEDLPYDHSQLESGESQEQFANQLATLMQDKQDLQIKVCPIVTPADLPITAGKTTLSDIEKSQLLEFGEQRAGAFKRMMVETKNITSSRLLLCTPEIEIKDQHKPRIKFSI